MATTLGELLVRLGIDPSGLAQGEAAAVGSFGRLESSVKSLALGFAGVGAAFAAGDFLAEGIKNAVEEQESIDRLTASLRANAPAWDGTFTAINRQVDAAGRLGFADDEVRGSLTLLVGATHDVGQAIALQNAAMDLARFKGISLSEATLALTTIEGGRARGLATLGINTKDYATITERVAAVEAVAAGQAAAAADTIAGEGRAAGVAMREAGEAIGTAFIPVLKIVAEVARDDVAPALKAVGDNGELLVPVFDALGVLIGVKLVTAAGQAAIGFLGMGAAAGTATPLVEGLAVAEDHAAVNAGIIGSALAPLAAGFAGVAGLAQIVRDHLGGLQGGAYLTGQAFGIGGQAAQTAGQQIAGAGTAAQTTAGSVAQAGQSLQDQADAANSARVKVDEWQRAAQAAYERALILAQNVDLANAKFIDDNFRSVAAAHGLDIYSDAAGTATTAAEKLAAAIALAAQVASIPKNPSLPGGTADAQTQFGFTTATEGQSKAFKDATDSYNAMLAAFANYHTQGVNAHHAVGTAAASMRADVTSAFSAAKDAAHQYFDAVHQQTLAAIADQHAQAIAIADTALQQDIAANHAKANAEKDALTKKQAGEQFAQLSKAVSDAQLQLGIDQTAIPGETDDQRVARMQKVAADQQALAAAQTALEDFQLQQQINADEATATQADAGSKAKHDAAVANANKAEKDAQTAENTRYQNQVKAFDLALSDVQRHLAAKKATINAAEQEIVNLLGEFGIKYRTKGKESGEAFIAGLAAAIGVKPSDVKAALALDTGSAASASVSTAGASNVLGGAKGVVTEGFKKGPEDASVLQQILAAIRGLQAHIQVYLGNDMLLDKLDTLFQLAASQQTSGFATDRTSG